MNDDGFRLTPVDVRGQEFRKKTFGYDPEGVEDFRQRVADELERLLRERALNEAVVMAQKMREETETIARRNSEVTMQEAHVKAEEIIAGARTSEADVRRDIETVQLQFTGYLSAFRQLLLRQLAELDALAEHERDGSPPQ